MFKNKRETWGHPLSTYAIFSEKLTFLTPLYAHIGVRIRGLEMSVIRKILRTYLMDGPDVLREFVNENIGRDIKRVFFSNF